VREAFLADHRWLDDERLLAPPAGGPFTPLTLFTCTYVTQYANLHMDFVELSRLMCANTRGCVLVVNSNFGHAAQPGYEAYIKTPRPPKPRPAPARSRARKVQGDGTCFNSAVETLIAIPPGVQYPAPLAGKPGYFVKCFPSTGETQVPGVICADLRDGAAVLENFVAYLNELGVGSLLPAPRPSPGKPPPPAAQAPAAPAQAPAPVLFTGGRPTMLDYKFRLHRSSPRILVNLRVFAAYLRRLEVAKLVEGDRCPDAYAAAFRGWPEALLPPFAVRETKPPDDDGNVSFHFECGARAPRVNVFPSGKVNVLGAATVESAERMYVYFVRLFTANWAVLVCLKPRRDAERLRPCPRPRLPAPELAPPDACFAPPEDPQAGAPASRPAPPAGPGLRPAGETSTELGGLLEGLLEELFGSAPAGETRAEPGGPLEGLLEELFGARAPATAGPPEPRAPDLAAGPGSVGAVAGRLFAAWGGAMRAPGQTADDLARDLADWGFDPAAEDDSEGSDEGASASEARPQVRPL
jgi:hypothetical protein